MNLFKLDKCIPAKFIFDNISFNKAHPFPYVVVEMKENIEITRLNSFGKKTKDFCKIQLNEINCIKVSCIKGFNGGLGEKGIVPLDFYLKIDIIKDNNDRFSLMNSSVIMVKELYNYANKNKVKYCDVNNLLEILKNIKTDLEACDVLLPISSNFKHFLN